ncbi:FecR family protein [Chitinophaga niabensis]|uniref:FecR family protein n=1 Tax=Chitinophaga niabensis TaxID=536979 RepID=UPI0031BAAB3D
MDLQRPEPEDFLCDESFLRFCGGEYPDTLFWNNWVKENPEYTAVVDKALRLYDMLNAGQGNSKEQLAAMKDAIARREDFQNMVSRSRQAKMVQVKRPWIRYAAAAAAILLITGGSLAYLWKKGAATGLQTYEHYTAAQSRKTVVLPDSSVIMLNANSHLSISKHFDNEHREVTITGEAFFDIKHDQEHPFIVHTSEYRIRVLGTSFNVKSYPGSHGTETDLISGKVEIVTNGSNVKERIILRPNEKFVLEREHQPAINKTHSATVAVSKGTVEKINLDTLTRQAPETSWARQKMEIKDETFEQIALKLQAWYGIRVIFASEDVKQYRYTATFNDETIFKALQYLKQSYPFNYRIEQDAIVISRS